MTINLATKFVCNVVIRTYVHTYMNVLKVIFKTLCIMHFCSVIDYCFSSIQQFNPPHINKILFLFPYN